jgi:hypothetical protein
VLEKVEVKYSYSGSPDEFFDVGKGRDGIVERCVQLYRPYRAVRYWRLLENLRELTPPFHDGYHE